MLIWGHGVGAVRSFSIITYEETLGIHFNITNAANAFISLTPTQYPVTSVATSAMTISNYPVTNSALTSYTTSEVVDSDQFLSDISYWLRDYYAYNLVHNAYIGNNNSDNKFRKGYKLDLLIKWWISKFIMWT